jgi:hypothetical protein
VEKLFIEISLSPFFSVTPPFAVEVRHVHDHICVQHGVYISLGNLAFHIPPKISGSGRHSTWRYDDDDVKLLTIFFSRSKAANAQADMQVGKYLAMLVLGPCHAGAGASESSRDGRE